MKNLFNAFNSISQSQLNWCRLKLMASVCLILSLISCASEQEKEAFNRVGDYFEANVNYSKGFSTELGKKNVKYIKLDVKGGPYMLSEKPKLLAAYAAVVLYKNLTNDTALNYTDIIISLFDNESQKEPNYTKSFKIETIRNVAEKSTNFEKAAQLLLQGTPSDIFDLIADKFKRIEEKEPFVSTVEKMKIERSGVKDVKLVGVELLINNTTNDRILSFSGQVTWGNSQVSSLTVRTFEDPNAKGILTLNIK